MFQKIVLILTIMTPPGMEDVSHRQEMKDLSSCYEAAAEFTQKELSQAMREHGVVGKMAGCAVVEMPSQEN